MLLALKHNICKLSVCLLDLRNLDFLRWFYLPIVKFKSSQIKSIPFKCLAELKEIVKEIESNTISEFTLVHDKFEMLIKNNNMH